MSFAADAGARHDRPCPSPAPRVVADVIEEEGGLVQYVRLRSERGPGLIQEGLRALLTHLRVTLAGFLAAEPDSPEKSSDGLRGDADSKKVPEHLRGSGASGGVLDLEVLPDSCHERRLEFAGCTDERSPDPRAGHVLASAT